MFGNALQGWHLVILLLVVLLLFGAPKLPALARSIGQSMKILKEETKSAKPAEGPAETAAAAPTDGTSPAGSADTPTKQ